jgi:hypothetical protein
MSTLLWTMLAAIPLAAVVVLGLAPLRKGHDSPIAIGTVSRTSWNAPIAPTPRAASGSQA